MHQTLNSIVNKDINSINKIIIDNGIGIRIFDEAHSNFQNICRINSLSNVEQTFYLTATPSRSDYKENYLFKRIFFNVEIKEVKDDYRYRNIILYDMNTAPSFNQIQTMFNPKGFDAIGWAKYFYKKSTDYSYNIIMDLFKRLQVETHNRNVAIILPTLDLINRLYDKLKNKNFDVSKFVGGAKNKTESSQAFQHKIVITNEKMFGKGKNVPSLDIMINFVQFSSASKLEQLTGRLRQQKDKVSIFVDIADFGFEALIRQRKSRVTYFNKIAREIFKISQKGEQNGKINQN
jgi:superfamily II DNA or RNA helicase